jgi:hypothetical protein
LWNGASRAGECENPSKANQNDGFEKPFVMWSKWLRAAQTHSGRRVRASRTGLGNVGERRWNAVVEGKGKRKDRKLVEEEEVVKRIALVNDAGQYAL